MPLSFEAPIDYENLIYWHFVYFSLLFSCADSEGSEGLESENGGEWNENVVEPELEFDEMGLELAAQDGWLSTFFIISRFDYVAMSSGSRVEAKFGHRSCIFFSYPLFFSLCVPFYFTRKI